VSRRKHVIIHKTSFIGEKSKIFPPPVTARMSTVLTESPPQKIRIGSLVSFRAPPGRSVRSHRI
jgi:hypothetical protein